MLLTQKAKRKVPYAMDQKIEIIHGSLCDKKEVNAKIELINNLIVDIAANYYIEQKQKKPLQQ